jgi:hypothetical protein
MTFGNLQLIANDAFTSLPDRALDHWAGSFRN